MQIILQERILASVFCPERSSIIYLSQPAIVGESPANELIELDLHNQTVLERYVISNPVSGDPPVQLMISRKKGLLILTMQPSLIEIWQLSGMNSIYCGETRGKNGYELQFGDISNVDGTMFFSAIAQRNIYCLNLENTISSQSLNLSKLKLPLKVSVHDLKCHPCEQKLFAACSDNQIRIWNQTTFTELIGIIDEYTFTAMAFQLDGQKLLTATEDGRILCWDAKTLGNRNILLACLNLGTITISLHWLNYNGAFHCDDFLVYQLDGQLKLMNLTLLVPQQMIREQKVSKSKRQELFGNIIEKSTLGVLKNDLKVNNFKLHNIQVPRFLQSHPYANFISITVPKMIFEGGVQHFQMDTQIAMLNQVKIQEYPVCAPQISLSFLDMVPDTQNQILCARYLYFIDQLNLEIKQYCLAKGNLRTIANLKNIIFSEDAIYSSLNLRPNTREFTNKSILLFQYKIQRSQRTVTVVFDHISGQISDNVKEFPAELSMFLGMEHLQNPPLFLIYEDRQSFSLIFEESMPRDDYLFTDSDKDKLVSMKQSLNVKVDRVFWTPIRQGHVVIYKPFNENVLRFSRNRHADNLITDMLMWNEMTFRLTEPLTDVIWQNNTLPIGAIVCKINVFIVNENLETQKVISLQPQINLTNRILICQWIGHTLLLQTKFHILYVLLSGKCDAVLSLDGYEEKNILCGLLWDRVILLSQSYQKRSSLQIKTKSVNLLQPILQGYLHNQAFIGLPADPLLVSQILTTFASSNLDYTLVEDLESSKLRIQSKFIMGLDDCRQFTNLQRAKYQITVMDWNALFDRLQLNYSDPRNRSVKLILETALQSLALVHQYKKSNEFSMDESTRKVLNSLPGTMDFYEEKIAQIEQLLDTKIISDTSPEQLNEYFIEQSALLLQKSLPIASKNFGEDKYNFIYHDIPNDEDEPDQIKDGVVRRLFDKIVYDSIVYFLGVGGQPIAKTVGQLQKEQEEEPDIGEGNESEFQDLLLYWRIDEGKGNQLEDLGDYGCQGEIIGNADDVWQRLEESEPMEREDKWGKKSDAQYSIILSAELGLQSKKRFWKKKQLECFTIEFWVCIGEKGKLMEIGDFRINLQQEVEIYLNENKLQFTADTPESIKELKQKWTHVCITYERSSGHIQLFLDAMHSFTSSEIELSQDLFKDKLLKVGFGCTCQVTEIRIWKQKLSLNEVKDGFRTPLSLVSEKKTQLRMKLKQNKEQAKTKGDLKSFVGLIGLEIDQPAQSEDNNNDDQQFKESEHTPQGGPNDQQAQFDNPFNTFGQPQQAESNFGFNDFGSSFGFQANKATDQPPAAFGFNDFQQLQQIVTDQQNFDSHSSDTKQAFKSDFNMSFDKPEQQQPVKQQSPAPIVNKQTIVEIQQIVDEAMDHFTNLSIVKGINNITIALDKLKEIISGNDDKLKKIQKFIIHCSIYRFAFQLLIGIKQMFDQNNRKKEVYLFLILIHLNIKPAHRIHWIIQSIKKFLEYKNTQLAETMLQQLMPSLSKYPPTPEDQAILNASSTALKTVEKVNEQLMRLTCPNCSKHLHFKGSKKCSKCTKEFFICSLTLSCISREQALQCKACELIFSQNIKQKQSCPICKFDKLQPM